MTVPDSAKIIHAQIANILEQLTNEQYNLALDIFNGSTVGQHVRHILDFYQCIVQHGTTGKIDYSDRERNRLVETDKLAAMTTFMQVLQTLEDMSETGSVHVVTDFSTSEHEERPSVQSSVGRELMYAYDHAVHHLAIIKMGIQAAFPHVIIDKNTGVAPSTIKYQSKN